jgi:hypothetical protein
MNNQNPSPSSTSEFLAATKEIAGKLRFLGRLKVLLDNKVYYSPYLWHGDAYEKSANIVSMTSEITGYLALAEEQLQSCIDNKAWWWMAARGNFDVVAMAETATGFSLPAEGLPPFNMGEWVAQCLAVDLQAVRPFNTDLPALAHPQPVAAEESEKWCLFVDQATAIMRDHRYAMNIWLELWGQEFTDAQKAAKRGTRIDTTFDYELWLID